LEKSHQDVERFYIKLTLGITIGLLLVVLTIWGGHHYYARWQAHKLMREAHESLERGEDRRATIAARRVIDLDPSNIDGCRTLAELAEKHSDVTAIDWRRRVIEIEPNSLQNTLALATTALKFNRFSVATDALARVSAKDKQTADYQGIAARLAVATGDPAAAESHLVEAAALAPEDPRRQLDLALFQLESPDPQKQEQGRTSAQRLKEYPSIRADALRGLIMDAARQRNSAVALDLGRELRSLPEATFPDRVLYLSTLKGTADPSAETYLANLQAEAAGNAGKVAQLVAWMNSHGLASAAVKWATTFDATILADMQVRLALADVYTQLRDWSALQQLAAKSDWREFEFLRLAVKARVAHETGDNAGFEKQWAAALHGASENPQAANILERVASGWGWNDKAVEVLWMLSENRELQRDALQTLYRYYSNKRDAAGLYRVLARLIKVTPNDPRVKNNFAQLALLLNADLPRARAIAKELYQSDPTSAVCVSTYAFSLYRAGEIDKALKIMKGLSTDQLRDPSVATYYGIILSSAGQRDQAEPFLKLAEGTRLLPEEEKMIAQARAWDGRR
jgi:predicted Zn-dependent protease